MWNLGEKLKAKISKTKINLKSCNKARIKKNILKYSFLLFAVFVRVCVVLSFLEIIR